MWCKKRKKEAKRMQIDVMKNSVSKAIGTLEPKIEPSPISSAPIGAAKVDTFEKEEPTKNKNKIIIWGVIAAAILTAICIITRRKPKATASELSNAPKATPKSEPHPPKTTPASAPEKPKITLEKNGDPRTLLGIEEGEAKKLRSQFETYKTKYWDEEWYALHKEEYRALEAKIRKYNISVVDKKVFSENPLEQITEKHKYIQEILGRAEYNEASYYDALLMFEKYGTREEYRDVGTSTLSQIKTALPKNPTEKTVNKVMDIYEKYGKFYMDGDELGLSDGLSYMTIIAKKDVIKTEEQLKRALNKGKNIIWNNDAIYDLHYALTKAQNAPMKESQSVKNVIDQFYETAYANRTAYKDHLDIKMMEESWDIKRD